MKIVRNETFSYFIPYQKKKQVKFFSKKTFLFPFKKQAEITKFSGGLRPPNPPQVSLKISLEPLRPRGGVVVFENTVTSFQRCWSNKKK